MVLTVPGIESDLSVRGCDARRVAHEARVHGGSGPRLRLAALETLLVEVDGDRIPPHVLFLSHDLDGVVVRVIDNIAGTVTDGLLGEDLERCTDLRLELAGLSQTVG